MQKPKESIYHDGVELFRLTGKSFPSNFTCSATRDDIARCDVKNERLGPCGQRAEQ